MYSVKKSRDILVVPAGIANSYKDYVYPASFGQQALYTYEQLAKIKSAYNILLTFNLKGSLDLGLITKSVYALVNRHNLLRTQLKFSEDKLYQVEKDQYYPEIIRVTLNGDDNDSLEQQLNYTLAEYKAKPFNMLDDTLFSVLLITKNDKFHVLAFKLHHIILDYMSVEILRRDFISLLQTNKLNMLSDLPALKLQYSDYVFWQKEFSTSTRADKQKDFWVKYLANSPALIFPDEENQKEGKSRVGVWRTYSLTKEKTSAIQNFSKKADITMFMLVIAALHQVISYQCKQSDLTIGTPISTRENPDLENIVGLMLNTLVMRIDSSKFETVGELLSSVQKNCISVFDNREIAYEEVLKHFRTHGIASKDLYRVRLVYRKIDANVEKVISDVEIDRFEMDRSEARFDLLVTLNDDGSVIDGELEYNASIWNSQRIDAIIEQFKEVLYLFSGSGEISLKEIQKRFQDIERKALTENIERSKAKKLSSLMSLAD